MQYVLSAGATPYFRHHVTFWYGSYPPHVVNVTDDFPCLEQSQAADSVCSFYKHGVFHYGVLRGYCGMSSFSLHFWKRRHNQTVLTVEFNYNTSNPTNPNPRSIQKYKINDSQL